ncbi:hypothetical protein MN116_004704 [Schistosoma mekongi]|uniref:Uncharacterized protein n=1 Tax=Schistosoma mekongi TaxID=38744 RepID=A0AAE1ZD70_SCHME|nr:hypothetical protein MN116_004704 [Schistosoma mekongi]
MDANLTTPDFSLGNNHTDDTLTVVNIAVPIISVAFFIASVVITYFIDDPGIKTLKNTSSEDNLMSISESDRNHLRYLAERKLYIDMKGHTFSAFTPSHTPSESAPQTGHDHSASMDGGRRRACSESHAHNFNEINSETQIILQHMLMRAGHAHNAADSFLSGDSGRSRSGFSNPFSSLKKPKSTKTEA